MKEPKEMEREERYKIELLRLNSLFADYLDKSTNFMILGIIGSIVFVIPLILILMTFYSPLSSFSALLASISFSYAGFAILYFAFLRKRRFKKSFDKYLEMISSESLMSSSDYQRLLISLRNELVHSLTKEGEGKTKEYPSEDKIQDLKTQVASLHKEVKDYEREKQKLLDSITTYNQRIAELEQKINALEKRRDAVETYDIRGPRSLG